jgi:hypothetical protein
MSQAIRALDSPSHFSLQERLGESGSFCKYLTFLRQNRGQRTFALVMDQ